MSELLHPPENIVRNNRIVPSVPSAGTSAASSSFPHPDQTDIPKTAVPSAHISGSTVSDVLPVFFLINIP